MNGLIRASLGNPYAVTVMALTIVVVGLLGLFMLPVDILPIFRSPAVQTLTFYNGMPASTIEKDLSHRMERWVGQASGTARLESRSILGASIVRNYFQSDVDPAGALTQVSSLAQASMPTMPPGTLPPVVLPFDPTSTTPIGLVVLDAPEPAAVDPDPSKLEALLYDVGRYEVRPKLMSLRGAVTPVVYGGKVRAVLAYLDREKLQARGLSPVDVMTALDRYNVFLPAGDARFGDLDFAMDSNSMFDRVEDMGDIPLRTEAGNAAYLRDVASPEDAYFIQTNIVRVNGRKQVYIPVYRQLGSSTLSVIESIRKNLGDFQQQLSRSGIELKLVMDQSIFVRRSIEALAQEGLLGAALCSLVILLFLGEWRMTAIAVLTLPLSVLSACIGLYFSGQTINVMTLAGLSLAIGPMVDSAIICLENTHRHLSMGASPSEAAFLGASEVAVPELVAGLCTLLVLAPLALMPGLGQFLFRPMALAVAFAMTAAYLLSRTFVPSRAARWLRPSRAESAASRAANPLARLFRAWIALTDRLFGGYARVLDSILRHRRECVGAAVVVLGLVLILVGPRLRREFYPEVDAGAFEMYVRAPSGTRIERTHDRVAAVEAVVHDEIARDVQTVISEIGVTPDWSAAYTPNAGPMDAVVKIQLREDRKQSAQEYVSRLRTRFARSPEFADLEFAFDAGGMIRSAMNEGRSSPISVRITGKEADVAMRIAEAIREQAVRIDGVVDARIIQRLDYPQYVITVDRAKAAVLGLTQDDVMKNVIAAFNSSIQFNKRNFWIDPRSKNQYFVGVSYRPEDIESVDTLLDIPVTSRNQNRPVPLRNLVTLSRNQVPTEATHHDIQPAVELTMGVQGRDLGHIADDVGRVLNQFGNQEGNAVWRPFDPSKPGRRMPLGGAKIVLSGEYENMRNTFRDLAIGLVLASMLIYFLMVALFQSYVTPLVIMVAVPLGLVGVVLMLAITGTAISIQSLLGVIFMVGIVVSNSVLMVDFAQNLRRHDGLSPTDAIRRAAAIRVKPVVMTALAAFFALVPMSLGIERGSEANAPLGRAVIGGLLAGMVTTLAVIPALYSLTVRDSRPTTPR